MISERDPNKGVFIERELDGRVAQRDSESSGGGKRKRKKKQLIG